MKKEKTKFKENKGPKVTILLLNYNGWEYAIECLESVYRTTYPNWELLFVDNGSNDGSVSKIKEWAAGKIQVNSKFLGYAKRKPLKQVEELFYDEKEGRVKGTKQVTVGKNVLPNQKLAILRIGKNRGFTGGNNIGLEHILQIRTTDYVLLLSNDTVVNTEFVGELVKAAESDEKIGMCACKMLFWSKPEIINAIGGIVLKDGTAVGKGLMEKDCGQYDKTEDLFSPSGGAGLYKRKMLDKIGLLDPDYFGYYEDVDLAWRGRLAGWRCVYVPTAVVYHRHSASFKEDSPAKLYYSHRNRIWTMVKNFSLSSWLLYLPWILNSEIISIMGAIISGRWAVIRGKSDALAGLGAFLGKRLKIQRTRRVDEQDIRKIIDKDHKEFYRNKKLDLKIKDIAMRG